MDESLFRWINHWPEGLAPLFHFLSEGNKTWPVRLFLVLVVVWFLFKGGRWRAAAILAVISWLVSNTICDLLKFGFQWPRPCVALPDTEVILRVKRLTSFGTASAHAASMAAVAFVFTALLGRWGCPWIALAFLVGLSRIFVGVHFPSQVALGWLVGCVVAALFCLLYRRMVKHNSSEQESQPSIPNQG